MVENAIFEIGAVRREILGFLPSEGWLAVIVMDGEGAGYETRSLFAKVLYRDSHTNGENWPGFTGVVLEFDHEIIFCDCVDGFVCYTLDGECDPAGVLLSTRLRDYSKVRGG